MMENELKLIECPRDAMQSFDEYIPASVKAEYINTLLKVGFHTIDFASFVSPQFIPQFKDSKEIIENIDTQNTNTKLLAIIANLRGAEDASTYQQINYLGFAYSLSPTFLKLNINSTPQKAFDIIETIQNKHIANSDKELILYLSLAFGNPYGDNWNFDILINEINKFRNIGIKTIVLADTFGEASADTIAQVFNLLFREYNNIEFGLHLHSKYSDWYEKIDSAYKEGCRRFDSAMLGFGGCPMSGDELVGNLNTENLIHYFRKQNIPLNLNESNLNIALEKANAIFNKPKPLKL